MMSTGRPLARYASRWNKAACATRSVVRGLAPPLGEPRFTNDIDIIADFNPETLDLFLASLPETFFAERDDARKALRLGRSFNVIYVPMAFKFDFFPAGAFPIGGEELDRAVWLDASGLSDAPAPFVTAEDILLDKLHWFQAGGQVSEVQWRDVQGVVRGRGALLDRKYLEESAAKLGIRKLLDRALGER